MHPGSITHPTIPWELSCLSDVRELCACIRTDRDTVHGLGTRFWQVVVLRLRLYSSVPLVLATHSRIFLFSIFILFFTLCTRIRAIGPHTRALLESIAVFGHAARRCARFRYPPSALASLIHTIAFAFAFPASAASCAWVE
ncbi:hypothetical protein RSOLAG1IB_03514 [Rhizoctonia solani AG-1 IB]|uniref:Uncharacterized protein n=1 Tax=Thanatephorus cucumeris (strain AG1-IB / isolate 7/3/14) TaxID=1108050 RepID=A0A0B7FNS5_THACB|nr:hypothetical protein RSOLAG1IB_03514 [Rhizoctonia solani AG-1 IB]